MWYDEPNIYKFVYSDTVSTDDVTAANKEFHKHLNGEGDQKIHLLVDISGVKKVSFSIGELMGNAAAGQTMTHPRFGYVVYYNDKNAFNNFISKVLGKDNANAVRIVSSEEKAVDFIRSHSAKPE